MPRLRVTTALSLLALLVGIWGTHWLSGFTDDWIGPPPRGATAAARPPRAPSHHRSHTPPRVLGAEPEAGPVAAPVPPPSLVPLETPAGPSAWAELQGHLDGRVVLEIDTGSDGRVTDARVARTSGDPVLDAHALATVRHWRFAVPAGSSGVRGQLPMRFQGPKATPP
ncbi:MAG TPA: energy transducer TonB [Frateuria sp.]|uniref:energy transducer TonB family protein n=1 Tax=Frateuria sp. TaxID=2211372 RepID=UPI002DEA027A|nr:energy transducer TonB [Frateuria sp.]